MGKQTEIPSISEKKAGVASGFRRVRQGTGSDPWLDSEFVCV
jgi:hypothetical protein